MHLASALKKWADFDYELKVVDSYTLGHGYDEIKDIILNFSPDIFGVSSVTIRIYDANYICSIAKEVNGNIITAIGGPRAISIPSDLVHYPNTDIFVVEEGEISFFRTMPCRLRSNRVAFYCRNWVREIGSQSVTPICRMTERLSAFLENLEFLLFHMANE